MSLYRKPLVAIVGRPNVGKSAIFNRLANRRIAIVHDEPGVTRDRITTEVTKVRIPYDLVDTGGIGSIIEDGFSAQVRTEADIAIAAADVILFVVDAREGVHPIDHELASVLRRSHTEVILLVNKVDTAKTDADAKLIHMADDGLRLLTLDHKTDGGHTPPVIRIPAPYYPHGNF